MKLKEFFGKPVKNIRNGQVTLGLKAMVLKRNGITLKQLLNFDINILKESEKNDNK